MIQNQHKNQLYFLYTNNEQLIQQGILKKNSIYNSINE